MKYSRIQKLGVKYHVRKNNTRIFSKSHNTELEAKNEAAILSYHFYLNQANEARKLINISMLDDNGIRSLTNDIDNIKEWVERTHTNLTDWNDFESSVWC